MTKIDALSIDQTELHRLEWEIKQRTGEIWQLQKVCFYWKERRRSVLQALGFANEALFQERECLMKLHFENDHLKQREIEDQKKIQYLLSLTNPGEQEIKYLRNAKPDTIEFPPSARRLKKETQNGSLLRTVYLPTANADSLILKIETLQTQLNEQVTISTFEKYVGFRDSFVLNGSRHC